MIQVVTNHISEDYIECEMLIPYDQGQVVSYFNENANVLATAYEQGGTKLLVECKHNEFTKYRDYAIHRK